MYSEEVLAKFWSRVEKTDTCWLWTGAKSTRGYGALRVNGKPKGTHRISLEIHLGRAIKKGLVVGHMPVICHNTTCVNPSHLKECTQSENLIDRQLDGTQPDMRAMNFSRPRLLSEEQIRSIRSDTRTQKVIATTYGISQALVSDIRLRNLYTYAAPS